MVTTIGMKLKPILREIPDSGAKQPETPPEESQLATELRILRNIAENLHGNLMVLSEIIVM